MTAPKQNPTPAQPQGQPARTHSHDTGSRPFPTEFPAQEINTVIAAVRGPDQADLLCAAHCALTIVDFGLGLAHGEGHADFAAAHGGQPAQAAQAPGGQDVVQLLEQARASHQQAGGRAAQAAAVPWNVILPALMNLLMQWLQRR